MPNLTLTSPTPLRFDGEFGIEPAPGASATTEETAVLQAVTAALDVLAADEARDLLADYPKVLLQARKGARTITVSDLKSVVQGLIGGQLTPAGATERAIALAQKYRVDVPKFATKDAAPPRFEGDFNVVVASGYTPTLAEAKYLDILKTAVNEFADDETADPAAKYSPSVLAGRKEQRRDKASRLRSDADKFCKGDVDAEAAAGNVLVVKGMYRALRDRLTRQLFSVTVMKEHEKKKGEELGVDLDIGLASGLPSPEDAASPEKQDLFVQINKSGTVIRTVCQRMQDRAEGWWSSRADAQAGARAKRLLDEYVDKLSGIAQIGLEDPHTTLAKLALAELRNEFVAREAGRIKNRYVRWLGLWAGLATVLFLAVYVLITRLHGAFWWQHHKAFLLAAAGAAIGTWVSFSVRQVQLSFDDLLMLEEDALDPPLRVLFVVAMTMTACLLFWTGAMNLEIGSLKTKQEAFGGSGSVALLVGVFAGLSERALATAISGRAAAFVKGLGSGG